MLTLEQLYAFVATVETGSFSAAARELGKVQSAVSQNIMNLEIDTNAALFDRSGRYPVLTSAGKKLLPQAQAVISQHKRLKQQVNALEAEEDYKLTLAIDEGVPYIEMIEILSQFSQLYPHFQLECLCAASQDVIHLVEQKRAHTGIVFSEINYPDSLTFETLGAVEFELFVSPSHPLAKQSSPHLDILKLHRQLVISSKEARTSWFNTAHSPDIWFADNYYMLLELAKKGLGWAFLPTHLCQEAITNQQLCKLEIEFEQPTWQANVDVIQSKGGIENEFNRQLRVLLRNLLV